MIHPEVRLIFTVSLLVFMIGNMLAMGLQLHVADVWAPLKNTRFVLTTLLACFVIGPALSYLTVLAVPMEQPYANGVLLLGMAPSAPFLPIVVKKAGGDLAAAAGLMVLATLGTILIMPLWVPLVAPGLSANAGAIERSLITLVLAPLVSGIAVNSLWPELARRIYGSVQGITAVGTVVFLGMVLILNAHSIVRSVGSHALLAQLLFVPALALAGYVSALGMPDRQRSVMSLGICTRNVGAAAAIVGSGGDQQTMVTLLMATLATVAFSFAEASWLARTAHKRAAVAEGALAPRD